MPGLLRIESEQWNIGRQLVHKLLSFGLDGSACPRCCCNIPQTVRPIDINTLSLFIAIIPILHHNTRSLALIIKMIVVILILVCTYNQVVLFI